MIQNDVCQKEFINVCVQTVIDQHKDDDDETGPNSSQQVVSMSLPTSSWVASIHLQGGQWCLNTGYCYGVVGIKQVVLEVFLQQWELPA